MKTATLIAKIEKQINEQIEKNGIPHGKQGFYRFVTPLGKFTVSTLGSQPRLFIRKLKKGLRTDVSMNHIVNVNVL